MIIDETYAFNGYNTWIRNGGSFSRPVLTHLVHSMRQDANNMKKSGEGRLRPSLIGDPCDRKQILSYLYKDGSDFDGNWFTWSGTFLHLAFQTWLLDQYRKFLRIEHKVTPGKGGPGVEGKCDWYWFGKSTVVPDGVIHGPHLGDYKTTTNLKNQKEPLKDKHVKQLLAEMYTMDIQRAYLVYQDRAYGYLRAYSLEAEDHDFEEMGDRLSNLQEHIEEKTLPDLLKPCRSHTGPYKECEFASICMELEYGKDDRAEEDGFFELP